MSDETTPGYSDPLEHAFFTLRIAVELGVRLPSSGGAGLPYSRDNDNLLFDAPLASWVCGRRIRFLRGWKQYESCVKGFNALGLMAEHVMIEQEKLKASGKEERRRSAAEFLRSRGAFAEDQILELADEVELFHLALWKAFARRAIVCSTSSNMGISLHEALRYMQQKRLQAGGKEFSLLRPDEGELIIWCPDENADFMNPEKTAKLRALESEKPALTTLHTYINRKQRDPGALKDALNSGGYFFPTNPQSPEEMQNLLAIALPDMAKERNVPFEDLLIDPNIQQALASLGALIKDDRVIVRRGVAGGLYGLIVPYLLMLEEILREDGIRAVSTWNQASIGAALAAIVLADMKLRRYDELPAGLKEELRSLLPRLHRFLDGGRLGRDLLSRIHGVFDIANLQSLAQLFGVVVTNHLSGRGTAFVGLGSSSYANGNSCFDILKESADIGGAFSGRDGLHPATHTMNPVAQALVYAEDLGRVAAMEGFQELSSDEQAARVQTHARKPEPAGAAAVAGYLLTRLDRGTLSLAEIACALKLSGFDKASFLEFIGFGRDEQSANRFIQEASEEGELMHALAKSLLTALDWDAAKIERCAAAERAYSRLNYRWNPLEEDRFEARNPAVNLYLTGDNCAQPEKHLVVSLLERRKAFGSRLREALEADRTLQSTQGFFDAITAVRRVAGVCAGALSNAQRGIDVVMRKALAPAVNRMILGAEKPRLNGTGQKSS